MMQLIETMLKIRHFDHLATYNISRYLKEEADAALIMENRLGYRLELLIQKIQKWKRKQETFLTVHMV